LQLHHVVLFVRDLARSTAFYRDGIGLETLVEREFDGDWPTLFGVTSTRLHAVILGDTAQPNVGQVELLMLAKPLPDGPPPAPPAIATVMLSFLVDLESVLPKLEAAGGGDVRRTKLRNGYAVATLHDPDGILVELLDSVAPERRSS
jgi:catechol 2,3-dioxygenase-like lactoylglutathione lyase family enzyme